MQRALLRKNIGEAQLLLAASMLVMFAFCWVRVWIVSLLPTDRFKNILEQFREFERFLPVPFDQLFTYPGRIALTYDELIVVMSVAIWSIARGSDAVAGELGRGTMEVLLAQPVGRLRVLGTQALVTTVGVALLAVTSWCGLYVGIHTTTVKELVDPPPAWPWSILMSPDQLMAGETRDVPMSTKVNVVDLTPAAVNLFALGFFLAGLSTFFSSLDRYRWRTIGIVAAIYVVQIILKIVGLASDSTRWLRNWTFFSAYEPERFVSLAVHSPGAAWSFWLVDEQGRFVELGPLSYNLLLVGMGLAAYVLAAWVFHRRDLPAPV